MKIDKLGTKARERACQTRPPNPLLKSSYPTTIPTIGPDTRFPHRHIVQLDTIQFNCVFWIEIYNPNAIWIASIQ